MWVQRQTIIVLWLPFFALISGQKGQRSTIHHDASNPNFELLVGMLKPLIPSMFENGPKDNLKLVQGVKSILDKAVVHHLKAKSVKNMTNNLLTRQDIDQGQLLDLVDEFNDYFKQMRGSQHQELIMERFDTFGLVDLAKAPNAKLGQDCFADVDHQDLALDVQNLALLAAKYLEARMVESLLAKKKGGQKEYSLASLNAKYHTDLFLIQATVLMAKIHRATLRNWHHLLMTITNFAVTLQDQ